MRFICVLSEKAFISPNYLSQALYMHSSNYIDSIYNRSTVEFAAIYAGLTCLTKKMMVIKK